MTNENTGCWFHANPLGNSFLILRLRQMLLSPEFLPPGPPRSTHAALQRRRPSASRAELPARCRGRAVRHLRQAIAGTFMALFAVRRAGMSQLELGVFLTASALTSIAASTVPGRRFDRHPGAAACLSCWR